MHDEGDVVTARDKFFSAKSNNLRFLLRSRYGWMNQYISETSKGIEVGCGTGISKEFISSKNYRVTDYADYDWLECRPQQ